MLRIKYLFLGGVVIMSQVVKVSKWGNSQGIRLSKETLKQIGINDSENAQLDMDIQGESIILKKKTNVTLEDLFKGFDLDAYYKHHKTPDKVDFGKPVGREIF